MKNVDECYIMKDSDQKERRKDLGLTEFINFGYKISQDYKNQRRIYLELNIAFMSFFSLAIKFFTDFFVGVPCAYNLIIIGFILLLIST